MYKTYKHKMYIIIASIKKEVTVVVIWMTSGWDPWRATAHQSTQHWSIYTNRLTQYNVASCVHYPGEELGLSSRTPTLYGEGTRFSPWVLQMKESDSM